MRKNRIPDFTDVETIGTLVLLDTQDGKRHNKCVPAYQTHPGVKAEDEGSDVHFGSGLLLCSYVGIWNKVFASLLFFLRNPV